MIRSVSPFGPNLALRSTGRVAGCPANSFSSAENAARRGGRGVRAGAIHLPSSPTARHRKSRKDPTARQLRRLAGHFWPARPWGWVWREMGYPLHASCHQIWWRSLGISHYRWCILAVRLREADTPLARLTYEKNLAVARASRERPRSLSGRLLKWPTRADCKSAD